MPRRFPIAQFPNRELLCALAAGAVAQTASGDAARAAAVVCKMALLVWAYEELFHGANWFRRLLGAGGAAYSLGILPGARTEA
jgi:hypothetical protein